MQELKKKFGWNCHYKTAASKLQNHLFLRKKILQNCLILKKFLNIVVNLFNITFGLVRLVNLKVGLVRLVNLKVGFVRLVYTIVSCVYCKWDIFCDFQPLWTGKDISFSLNKLGTKVSISNIGCRASGRDSSRHPGRKPFFFVKTTRIYYLVDNAPNLNFHLRAEFSIVGLTRIIRAWVSKSK